MAPGTTSQIIASITQKQWTGRPFKDCGKLFLGTLIMTSIAFIIGVTPLLFAEGAGAEMRHALGTAVFAGMIGVTAFGIFLTPVFFLAIQWVVDRNASRRESLSES